MASRSYSNLLDLATGAADQGPAAAAIGALRRRLPRVVTNPGFMDDSPASPSTPARPRTIIVANQLPIRSRRPASPEEPWTFEWDEDSLLGHLHHSSSPLMEFIYIGCLRDDIPQADQDAVAQALKLGHLHVGPSRMQLCVSQSAQGRGSISQAECTCLLCSGARTRGTACRRGRSGRRAGACWASTRG